MNEIPSNRQAEMGVIACLLGNPDLAADMFAALRPEDFLSGDCAAVFRAALAVEQSGQPLTTHAIGVELIRRDELKFLATATPDAGGFLTTPESMEGFVREIRECRARRELIRVANLAKEAAYDRDKKLSEVLDGFETDALSVRASLDPKSTHVATLREIMSDLAHVLEDRFERHKQGKLQGLSTGFPDLDRVTNGLVGSRVYILGARPKVGKTSLMRQILLYVSQPTPVYVATFEMNRHQMGEMMISQEGRIDADVIAKGAFKAIGHNSLRHTSEVMMSLSGRPVLLDDRIQTITQLSANVRRARKKHGIGLLMVDYLQLFEPADAEERKNPLLLARNASAGLVRIAKEHDIPVVALVALNREADETPCDQLIMRNIRDCGNIEQDAAFIGLMGPMPEKDEGKYKANTVDALTGEEVRESEITDVRRIGMKIVANRFGPGGDILPMTFEGRYMTFTPEKQHYE